MAFDFTDIAIIIENNSQHRKLSNFCKKKGIRKGGGDKKMDFEKLHYYITAGYEREEFLYLVPFQMGENMESYLRGKKYFPLSLNQFEKLYEENNREKTDYEKKN